MIGFLPLLAVIGLLIKADSPGPIFFTQVRPGKDGRRFKLYKFRTMVRDAHRSPPPCRIDRLGRMEPVMKVKNDPRVTSLGRWLRKSSLDELPQLWNVLRGEMSVVGTRPPTIEEVMAYGEAQKERLRGKPGLTGIAQIRGRTDLDFDSIVASDVDYIRHQSLGLYFRIILRTIPVLISGKSAY